MRLEKKSFNNNKKNTTASKVIKYNKLPSWNWIFSLFNTTNKVFNLRSKLFKFLKQFSSEYDKNKL